MRLLFFLSASGNTCTRRSKKFALCGPMQVQTCRKVNPESLFDPFNQLATWL